MLIDRYRYTDIYLRVCVQSHKKMMCPQAGQANDICLSSYVMVHNLALAMHYVTRFTSGSKTMYVTTRRTQCLNDFVYCVNLAFVNFAHSECLESLMASHITVI